MNRSPNPEEMTCVTIYEKKKEKKKNKKKKTEKKTSICCLVRFDVPSDPTVKIKENENRDNYFDHAREPRELWNLKATVIPKVIGAPGTINKGLVRELEELQIVGLSELQYSYDRLKY